MKLVSQGRERALPIQQREAGMANPLSIKLPGFPHEMLKK